MSRAVPFPVVAAASYAVLGLQAAIGYMPESAHLCPVFILTGHRCPGCGMGHALVSAMRGDFAASVAQHPLGLPLFGLWTAWLLWGSVNWARGRDFSDGFVPVLRRPTVVWAGVVLVLAAHAARSV